MNQSAKPHISLLNRRDVPEPIIPEGYKTVKIFSGGLHVSTDPNELMVTILGSCVAVCIRDPIAKVSGMNHFLLPGNELTISDQSDAARYGVHAMERLINGILKAGGRKDRLQFKVFGGGNVIKNSQRIGSKNVEFVRHFLKNENYSISSEDLEGDLPRRIHFYADTGRVMVRKLNRKEDLRVVVEETRYKESIAVKPVEGDIDLF